MNMYTLFVTKRVGRRTEVLISAVFTSRRSWINESFIAIQYYTSGWTLAPRNTGKVERELRAAVEEFNANNTRVFIDVGLTEANRSLLLDTVDDPRTTEMLEKHRKEDTPPPADYISVEHIDGSDHTTVSYRVARAMTESTWWVLGNFDFQKRPFLDCWHRAVKTLSCETSEVYEVDLIAPDAAARYIVTREDLKRVTNLGTT